MFIIDWEDSYTQEFRKRQAVGAGPDIDLRQYAERATARCPANIAAIASDEKDSWIIYAYMWHGDIIVFGWVGIGDDEGLSDGFVVGSEFEVAVNPDNPDEHVILTPEFQTMNFVNQFNVDDFLII